MKRGKKKKGRQVQKIMAINILTPGKSEQLRLENKTEKGERAYVIQIGDIKLEEPTEGSNEQGTCVLI